MAFSREKLIQSILLLLVLVVGAYFRLTGLMWGDYEYQHPDERFLVWVVSDIAPVEKLGDYFNTRTSSLNPANRGHGFYVYGDLPVIATRYLTEALTNNVGWEEILQVGRGLSAFLDLLTVLLVYLIAQRIAGWRVATLAGLFSAATVLQIQQAHFFTVDSFATAFSTLAITIAVVLATEPDNLGRRAALQLSIAFGAAVGLAMACKINTAVVAGLLPLAFLYRLVRMQPAQRLAGILFIALFGIASGAAALLVFRVAQPYAFAGPSFASLKIDDAWLKSIQDQQAQAAGDVDFPPSLQWARRSHLFSLQNLVLWGLGAPLGLLAWAGFLFFAWMAVRKLRRNGWAMFHEPLWSGGLLVWFWTGFYFVWQSMAWNPTMRYQLPIYPTLAVLAAWGVGYAWAQARELFPRSPRRWQIGAGVLGGLVLLLTLAWAFAFTRMYTRTETRVAASRWIFENVPGPVNLTLTGTDEGTIKQLLPAPDQAMIRSGLPYSVAFDSPGGGVLTTVLLSSTQISSTTDQSAILRASVIPADQPAGLLAQGEINIALGAYDTLELPLTASTALEPGKRYLLILETASPSTNRDPDSFTAIQLSGQLGLRLFGRVQQQEMPKASRQLSTMLLDQPGTLRQLRLLASAAAPDLLTILVSNQQTGEQITSRVSKAGENLYNLDTPLNFQAGVSYLVGLTPLNPSETLGPDPLVQLAFLDDPTSLVLPAFTTLARSNDPLFLQFSPHASGTLTAVSLGFAAQVDPSGLTEQVLLDVVNQSNPGKILARAQVVVDPANQNDPRGREYTVQIDPPLAVESGQLYSLTLTPMGPGAVSVRGSAPANETDWDMGLPFRTSGYDPFGGIYRGDLNFQMYWDDNVEKYQRFTGILDNADYIFMSSNRQWGTTTRLPERHPLTTELYRALLGCPVDKEVIWCYNVAEPGMFQGELGFELVKTFTSYPNLGPLQINTQFAEEAFTVYDHPKVMIFRKTAGYRAELARAVLSQVDLNMVVRITPKKAADFKDMLLPAGIWKAQQAGGTWASLFPPEGLQNRYPWLGLATWYFFLWLLGLVVYPLVRLALPGLADRGYPLARVAGMLLLAYPAWLAGSLGVPVTRLTLGLIFAILALTGAVLALAQRGELAEEWRVRKRYFLSVEAIALVLFCISLAIRLGNPDLWHPIYGGEKPMNFSQFNAVLKSTVFPAYDPWFSGGVMNYYYFGYVLVGMPVKLLGITPSVAYNLILPALFAMVGLAAFSIAANLTAAASGGGKGAVSSVDEDSPDAGTARRQRKLSPAITTGIIAILALLLLGNLGTPRMLWEGLQKLVVSEEQMRQGNLIEHWNWVIQGAGMLIRGEAESLPYYPGDWYWKPSRAIQPEAGNEITEFPFFTFLYADLHAHLMALPLTLLAVAWALSAALVRGKWPALRRNASEGSIGWLSFGLALVFGALVSGALRPANTWDQYTFLALGVVGLIYGQWIWTRERPRHLADISSLLWVVLPPLALAGLALLFYRPFDWYFGQGYNELIAYTGQKTGISSYLVHWGLFLFVIAAWLFTELVDWMAATPVSHLNKLRPFREAIIAAVVFLLLVLGILLVRGAAVALIAGPLGLLAALLIFRPGQPLAKRAVLFMIGTALVITLAVELVAVKGDLNRMNTVFKFYFQAWSLLSLSAAAALGWLLSRPGRDSAAWMVWNCFLIILVFGAALYPITATNAKVKDRMTAEAPRTLDGVDYMAFTRYTDGPDGGTPREMDLNQDYYAIQWVQRNIQGSPVIVEANTPEYRHWGTRFTIYTGLPGVVGWNWHERQQRALTPDSWVFDRIAAVQSFYRTTSPAQAEAFLDKYDVGVIVVGQLERIYYPGLGLEKFEQLNGVLWDQVYAEGETVIYRVR